MELYLCTAGGVFLGYLGYKLFMHGATMDRARLESHSPFGKVVLSGSAPGLFFMAFGAMVLMTAIVRPLEMQAHTGGDSVAGAGAGPPLPSSGGGTGSPTTPDVGSSHLGQMPDRGASVSPEASPRRVLPGLSGSGTLTYHVHPQRESEEQMPNRATAVPPLRSGKPASLGHRQEPGASAPARLQSQSPERMPNREAPASAP